MKKLLLIITLPVLFISCSVNKKALRKAYNTRPTAQEQYFGEANSLSPDAALAMIGTFPKHKLKGLRKHKLDSASSGVDLPELLKILNDKNVDSFRIFLAVRINPDDDSTFRMPTIVMQIKLKKETRISDGKGGFLFVAQYQYLAAPTLCPPPRGGCRVVPLN